MSINCFTTWPTMLVHCPHCLPTLYCAYCSPMANKPQTDRAAIIEECAKVAEKHEKPRIGVANIYYPIADAIRELKKCAS